MDSKVFCLYCGDVMNSPNEKQVKIFGKPKCCDELMLPLDYNKIHKILKGMETLKVNLEKELVKGFGCEQYVGKSMNAVSEDKDDE